MAEETGKSFARRDRLLEIESQVQKWWSEGDVFRADAKDSPPKAGEKLRGANVLLPFGFHCTGMPIKASADKLTREIEKFGYLPVFPVVKDEEIATGIVKYQWEIMQSYGLTDEEIAKFTNPYHWLTFFPPLAIDDLKAFGLGCDWRRTFITTDINPYFDSFVRWQMRKLKGYTIYSPLDGQPCADHDLASGEGVIPQEYTLIKMEGVSPFPPKMSVLEGKKVYLAACKQIVGCCQMETLNLAYQKLSRVPEKPTSLVELTGQDLIGLPLRSPLACNDVIYTLPMLSVLTDKGTGIFTSVPSDSPDDYMALHDLKAKPAFRAKYGVKDEWVVPFEIIPIIHHPDFGDKSAEKICIEKKIKSQNEREA
ncbi:hypothetical protein SASPL_138772 [Salvia splendens]|uniref:Leucyl-tRNA synthetase n=1 Tax=Salvia splendens TaxID=180675 RepID=A0A8X8WX94_SALSN|nr:hypothetical protein SASPL_138772 [Salvia splendens]